MPNFKSRRGSQIVEATMVLPVTILILASLFCLLLTFHASLNCQIEKHGEERELMYEEKEVSALRIKDSLADAAKEVAVQ